MGGSDRLEEQRYTIDPRDGSVRSIRSDSLVVDDCKSMRQLSTKAFPFLKRVKSRSGSHYLFIIEQRGRNSIPGKLQSFDILLRRRKKDEEDKWEFKELKLRWPDDQRGHCAAA